MYLDHAATARMHPAAAAFLSELPPLIANPSSSHGAGLAIRRRIDRVRQTVADAIGVYPEEIYFTGSASEANALIHLSLRQKAHIVTTQVEHSSVEQNLLLAERRGVRVTRVALREGTLHTEDILRAIEKDTKLVSIMSINNETGHRFHLEGLDEELLRRGIHFHRDAVQSLGKYPFSARSLTSASFSPHKIGSLSGLGILYLKNGAKAAPLYGGGGQEKGLRSGTHNTLSILCAGEVLSASLSKMQEHLSLAEEMRGIVRAGMEEIGGVTLSPADGSKYILSISLPDLPAEVVVSALSREGIYISAASACSSAAKGVSRVIRGFTSEPALEKGALRFSFSPFDQRKDVAQTMIKINEVIEGLRRGIA